MTADCGQRRIRVYHNVARDHAGRPSGMIDGYDPSHPVTLVAELHPPGTSDDPADVVSVLAAVFRLFNVGDAPEFGTPDPRGVEYRTRGNRSLSVGDVVAVEGQYFASARFSWEPISSTRIERTAVPGTSPERPQYPHRTGYELTHLDRLSVRLPGAGAANSGRLERPQQ